MGKRAVPVANGDVMKLRAAILAPALLVLGGDAFAASCTDDTDCYCDCVEGVDRGDTYVNDACETKDVPVDTSLIWCEDYEEVTMTSLDATYFGDGAPGYGPWYDDTGQTDARGANSYWKKTYGAPSNGCSYDLNGTLVTSDANVGDMRSHLTKRARNTSRTKKTSLRIRRTTHAE